MGSGTLLWIEHPLPFGRSYGYAPRPVIADGRAFLALMGEVGARQRAIFFRVEPEEELKIHNAKFRIYEAPAVQPLETIVIDLSHDDDALLAAMHPKTRYNIRVAERHGVVVSERRGEGVFQDFWRLLTATAARDGFRIHPRPHYEHLLQSNSASFSNELFFATYRGEAAAVALVNFYSGVATYLHGGSERTLGHLMAPHLLQWHIIREARRRGCRAYDLWGIDETHWPGVSRFKKRFGGSVRRYPGAFDVVFQPFAYQLYRTARTLARLRTRH